MSKERILNKYVTLVAIKKTNGLHNTFQNYNLIGSPMWNAQEIY